jgi:hypothetical protein
LSSLTTGGHGAWCSVLATSRAKKGDSAEIRTHPYPFVILIVAVDRILDGIHFMNRVTSWTDNPWTRSMRPWSYSTAFSIEK